MADNDDDDDAWIQPNDDFSVSVMNKNPLRNQNPAIAKAFPKTEFSTTLTEFPEESFDDAFGEMTLKDKSKEAEATDRFDSSFGRLHDSSHEMALNDETPRESRKDRKSSADKSRGRSRSKGKYKDNNTDKESKRRGRSRSKGALDVKEKRRGRSSGPLEDDTKKEKRRSRSSGPLDGSKKERKSRDRSCGPLDNKDRKRSSSKGPMLDNKVKNQAKERAKRVGQPSRRNRAGCLVLARQGKGILIAPRNPELLCDVFGCLRHAVDAVLRSNPVIDETPADRRVVDVRRAIKSSPGLGHDKGCAAHAGASSRFWPRSSRRGRRMSPPFRAAPRPGTATA